MKKKKSIQYNNILFIIITTVSVVLFLTIIGISLVKYNQINRFLQPTSRVRFISDEFSSREKPLALFDNFKDNAIEDNGDFVVLEGHFNENISREQKIFFKCANMHFEFYVNDEKIASFGEKGTFSGRLPGKIWLEVYNAPDITPEDNIKIIMKNYNVLSKYSLTSTMENIVVGGELTLLNHLFLAEFRKIIPMIICFVLAWTLIGLSISYSIMRYERAYRLAATGLVFFSLAIWLLSIFDGVSLIFPYPETINFLIPSSAIFAILFQTASLFGRYRKDKIFYAVLLSIIGLMIFITFILNFTKLFGIYESLIYIYIAIALISLAIIVRIGMIFYKHKSKKQFFVYLFLSIALFVQVMIDFSIVFYTSNIGHFYFTGLAIFEYCVYKIIALSLFFRDQYKDGIKARKLEVEVQDQKRAMLLNNIKPHFMFNCLNTIRSLCVIDPKQAEETVVNFSKYIRYNVDFTLDDDWVEFNKEVDHMQAYYNLIKQRFGDKYIYITNFEVEDFKLPVFSIEPILENAIKHGILPKQGGTIKASSYYENGFIKIVVEDNGMGFNPNSVLADGHKDDVVHVGLKSIKERLQLLCNGDIKIESKFNEGTKITVSIDASIKEVGFKNESSNNR